MNSENIKRKSIVPFGNLEIINMRPEQVFNGIKNDLKVFLRIDFENNQGFTLDRRRNLKRLFNILNLLQFGREKSPFLISLDFIPETDTVSKVSIWRDPYYEEQSEEKLMSVFTGDINEISYLPSFVDDPKSLFSIIKRVRNRSKSLNTKYDRALDEYLINKFETDKSKRTRSLREVIFTSNMDPDRVILAGSKSGTLLLGNAKKNLLTEIGYSPLTSLPK